MFLGFLNRIRSPQIFIDLGVLYDALLEQTNLSELLQNRGTLLVQADKMMCRTIHVLECMKEKSGTRSLEAKCASKEKNFKTVKLVKNKKLVTINAKQFLTSLINNMSNRLFCIISSNEKRSVRPESKLSLNGSQNKYANLLHQFKVLDKDSWPTDIGAAYGENEVKKMCQRFDLPHARTLNAYRD